MYKEKYMQIKPPPSSNLDSKSLAIWVTWSTLSAKEVAREAVMKGTHIELAKQFLSKKLDIEDTNRWFKNEIDCWILDLLLRKQIYRVMHIFQNMGVDPFAEMLSIFMDTCCKELRQNVGNHLMKHEKLDESHIDNWYLLSAIENQSDIIMTMKEKHISVNLNCIEQQSDEWRSDIGTELFFRTYDFNLKTFINANVAWTYLLKTNIDLLKYWINTYYTEGVAPIMFFLPNIDTENLEQLREIFINLKITDEMIAQVADEKNYNDQMQQTEVLNELAKYGVFCNSDKNHLPQVISRLLKVDNISNIEEVLSQKLSNFDLHQFNRALVNYCQTNNLYNVLNICYDNFIKYCCKEDDSGAISLISSNHDMSKDFRKKEILRNNIFDTAKFLSEDNLLDYFTAHPLILLSVIIFTKGICMHDLLSKRVTLKIRDFEINKEILLHCLKDCRYFINFCNKFNHTTGRDEVDYYQLLERHADLRIGNVYKHRGKQQAVLPNFNSKELIERYGYKKLLNFIYFLKNARPLYAYAFFRINHLDTNINEMDYVTLLDKVYSVALHNFKSTPITTSCVAFLEILGENSYPLRLYLKSANSLLTYGRISESEISRLFGDIPANCEEIYSLLEASINENINLSSNSSGSDLIQALKLSSVVVRFSTLHKLPLPELFLKSCAKKDLWLSFLIFVQIYNYPTDLTCKLLQNFASKSLIEHISHAISHDIQLDDIRNQLMGERDSRKSFLARLGVRLTDSSGGSSDMSSHSSYGSMANSLSSDFLESETLDYPTDLLEVLIRCHNSVDPPKALLFAARYYKCPLLAVLANSYEPDSVIINWITWLEVSCDIKESFINYVGVVTSDSVLEMFKHMLKKKYFKTLTNSFRIFLPENPLSIIMEFLNECIRFNFGINLQETLQKFMKKITYWRSNSYISEIDHDMSYFNNKSWIQNTAIFLIFATLQHGFQCFYDQILFMRFLNDIDVAQYFSVDFPDIKTLLNVNEYIYEKQYEFAFDLSLISNKNKYIYAITSYINELVGKELYEAALDLGQIINIPCDFIIFKQLKSEFERTSLRDEEFWRKWNEFLKNYKIPPDVIVDNYFKLLESTSDKEEMFTILKVTFDWTNKYNLENKIDVEKEMWTSYFQLDDKLRNYDMFPKENFTLLSEYQKELDAIPECYNVLNELEAQNFEKVIEYMLNREDIITALRLERIFGCTSSDLDILKLCLQLVEGTILPHQLTARQRLLLSKRNYSKGTTSIRRKTYITPRISSCASVASMSNSTLHLCLSDNVVMPSHDTLALLEMSMDNLKNGGVVASKIFKTYRISVNLQTKYQTILECEEPIGMLRKALEDNCRNKLEVVSDCIDIFKLEKDKIADLLYAEISNAIAQYSMSKLNTCFLWDINMDLDFNVILQLLSNNCSLLGFKLYYGCSNEFTTENMMRVTELLIRCHDCFTTDCNMEGISMVLKKCKSFTSMLEGIQDYNLMVRLLTGIGRYTEMTYIFHILRQQEQFELLLRKGSRKDGSLRIALLEYLKKYCPDDVDLYKIVALHFFLFSEIAELWEQEAIRYIHRIIALAKLEMQNYRLNPDKEPYVLLYNTEDNKKMLRKIMNKYSHASEYHLHGQKLTKAMTAAKQAQLVALQLSLYKDQAQGATIICILNITNAQISKLTLSEFHFQHILILVEAYNFEADWAGVLFEQYLLNDRVDFYKSFALTFSTTESLVHDISRLFLNSLKITPSMDRNMRTLLNTLNSIHAKYRIASELGFTDMVEELLASQQLSYLKDTVWKSGYKNVDD